MLRFDPFREFDRLVNGALETGSTVSVPLDVVRSSNAVTLHFDLPGVDPDTVELSFERNQLTLKATRRTALGEGERFVVRERPAGDFTRTLVLSEGLDASRISAAYEHGVLVVTIPVAELAQPRRIEINGRRPAPAEVNGAEPVEVGVSAN